MATYLFPDSWFVLEKLQTVIEYLHWLPIDPEDRKFFLVEWAARSGVEVTGEMIEAVTGEPAGKI